MAKRLSIILSQGQSGNPVKRQLEEELVTELLFESGIDVTVIPHLYDLQPDGTGILALQGIGGDMVVLSWLYPRAAHWLLDRNGIHGKVGETLLVAEEDDDDDIDDENETVDDKQRALDEREIPNRCIYCLDLRVSGKSAEFMDEIKRIATESTTQVVDLMSWIGGDPSATQMDRFQNPTNNTALGPPSASAESHDVATSAPVRIEEDAARRWYPVIDFGRCTNCMECIDFCLFGVYGVDGVETILVEQPDNCRKGCPACSRVCPENAIIFPQHKTPAIAGSEFGSASLKIDLSKLFGAPDGKEDAEEVATRERDEQLVLAGRDVVGPSGRSDRPAADHDELDDLIDELDELEL